MQAPRFTLSAAFILPAVLLAASGAALASTPEAWEEMRADVEEKCTAGLPEALGSPTIYVEPTGTASFGIALIEGLSPESKARVTYVCVYDKQATTVEISPAISTEFVRVVTESEREAMAAQKAATGDNKTVDESGQQ